MGVGHTAVIGGTGLVHSLNLGIHFDLVEITCLAEVFCFNTDY